MTLNLQISSFMNILNSTLLNFVKIRFVSHRKVDKCYLEGVLPPCISACSPPSIVHFRQTGVFFPPLPPVIQTIPTELLRVIARPAFFGMSPSVCSEVILEKGSRNEKEILWPHHLNKFILFTRIVANSWPLLDHSFEYLSQCCCSLLVSVLTCGVSEQFVAMEPLWWWKHYFE